MKVAFVFDTVLLEKGNDYYGMTLTYDFFKDRYLDKIDELTVITRCSKWKDNDSGTSGYKKTNGEGVRVSPVLCYKNIPDVLKKRKEIRKELKSKLSKVDKVIIRMPSVLGIEAARICRKNNTPYFIECVACALDGYWNHTNPAGKLIAVPMYFLIRKEIRDARRVLYVTNKFLQKRYPTNGEGYACSDVVIPSAVFRLKHKHKNGSELRLYTVANVGMKYKGHVYVFRAIKEMKKRGIAVKYYMIGNGNQTRLRKIAERMRIQDDIIFVGSVAHDEVLNMLTDADVYIQPSLQEGLPRALIEAMSVGCPAIASNAGGCPELLSSEYVFTKRNWHQLVKIIIQLSYDKKARTASSINRETAKKYDSTRLDAIRDSIYKDFINEKRKS